MPVVVKEPLTFFGLMKKELRLAKKAGDTDRVNEIMDAAEAHVEKMHAMIPFNAVADYIARLRERRLL